MKIYRNGKEIVLTDEEIMEAHAEHIKSFMRNELITVYGLPDEEAEDYAELAYSHYTSGNGYTEYDCIEWAVTIYDLPNLELEDSYLLLWPKGTKKFFSSLDDAVFAAATKVSFPFPAYEQIWILASNDKGKVVPVKKYRSSDLLLEDLWKSLTDVPFDPDSEDRLVLAEPWFNFPAGTDQEEIWAWFDERYSGGVAKLMFPSLFNPSQKEPSETASLLDAVEKKVFSMHSTNPDAFTDPDTILADLFSKVDMQLTGTSEELFNIYRCSGDKQAVKDLFLFFTDISFDEYLQKCIEETASLAVADLKS